MATPHVAGGMAIVTQYVEDNFPGLSTRERQAMVDRILMSTATPVIEAGGTYAAVMDQGAGEMNLAKAVTTKAYLTAEGTYSNRPKLELGDDPEKTGVYTLTFTVHNFGTTALNYTIDPSVLLEDIGLLGYMDEAQELPVIIYTGESWDIAAEGDPRQDCTSCSRTRILRRNCLRRKRQRRCRNRRRSPCSARCNGACGTHLHLRRLCKS